MDRIRNISSHLTSSTTSPGNCLGTVSEKNPTDVVIVSALRTPMTRARKGLLSQTAPELLLAHVFQATLDRVKMDQSLIEDVQVGNVLMPGAGAAIARAAMFLAKMNTEIPCSAVNRQCSSGLEACSVIAAKIKSGLIGR